ncbi:MAG: hypothetical protein JNK81_09615 [Anaerolineales bacterium]|nr:hypothetical protein [Anaerolineales bacterium]
MEIEKLLSALKETLTYLNNSESSVYSNRSVNEIIQDLEKIILEINKSQRYNKAHLGFLFAPTGAIQDTSIDNGWGDKFLEISSVVDHFVE